MEPRLHPLRFSIELLLRVICGDPVHPYPRRQGSDAHSAPGLYSNICIIQLQSLQLFLDSRRLRKLNLIMDCHCLFDAIQLLSLHSYLYSRRF